LEFLTLQEHSMKGIFVIILAVCLSACASQPTTAITADQFAGESPAHALPASIQPDRSVKTVYLEDYELIHVQAPPQKRGVVVLGAKKSG
jgi:hypothetical protein